MNYNTKTALWTIGTLLALGVACAHARTNQVVRLAWPLPADYTNDCGYRLYATNTDGGAYVWQFFAPTVTNATVSIVPATYTWFWLCAYNSLGEGPLSNPVHVPSWPIVEVDGAEETATDLRGPWTFCAGHILLTNPVEPARFWRATVGTVIITNRPSFDL